MTKTIMILAIAVAFVAGSMITGTIAFAAPGDQGKPFEALQAQIDSIPIGDSEFLEVICFQPFLATLESEQLLLLNCLPLKMEEVHESL